MNRHLVLALYVPIQPHWWVSILAEPITIQQIVIQFQGYAKISTELAVTFLSAQPRPSQSVDLSNLLKVTSPSSLLTRCNCFGLMFTSRPAVGVLFRMGATPIAAILFNLCSLDPILPLMSLLPHTTANVKAGTTKLLNTHSINLCEVNSHSHLVLTPVATCRWAIIPLQTLSTSKMVMSGQFRVELDS